MSSAAMTVYLDVTTALQLQAAGTVVGHMSAHMVLSSMRDSFTTPPGQTPDVPAHLKGFKVESFDLTEETGGGA